jgi:hypothetical protein
MEEEQPQTTDQPVEGPTETTEETVADETTEENVEDVKAKLSKAEELANSYKIRAEKAERLAKAQKVEVKPEAKELSMTASDIMAVVTANVHEDDLERVERQAKFEGVTVREILKTPEMKAILELRGEMRKTAQATNVSNARRSSAQVSPETILAKARKGDVPDGEDEIEKLVRSRKAYNK